MCLELTEWLLYIAQNIFCYTYPLLLSAGSPEPHIQWLIPLFLNHALPPPILSACTVITTMTQLCSILFYNNHVLITEINYWAF